MIVSLYNGSYEDIVPDSIIFFFITLSGSELLSCVEPMPILLL